MKELSLLSRRTFLRSASTAALAGWLTARAGAAGPKRKVLFFSKCSDATHTVTDRKGGALSYAERFLATTGGRNGIEFTFSKDGSLFSPGYLAQFDALCFYTTGDLLAASKAPSAGPGGDGNPPLTPAGKAALLDAVANGKGFVGIHAAADTFHTGETAETNTYRIQMGRYRNHGERSDPYIRMLGGEFIIHGTQQTAVLEVVDPGFPGFSRLGRTISRRDEWYSLKDFSRDLHVLLVQQTASMGGPEVRAASRTPAGWKPYLRPPYPSTWARMHGKGRVFYTSMGHGDNGPVGNDWDWPPFREILYGGLAWAAGNADADVSPNIERVTPGAWTLPPPSWPSFGPLKFRDPAPS